MEDREFFDHLYKLWSLTSFSNNRFWDYQDNSFGMLVKMAIGKRLVGVKTNQTLISSRLYTVVSPILFAVCTTPSMKRIVLTTNGIRVNAGSGSWSPRWLT